MATQLILTADKDRVTVSPGAQAELSVTINNLTALVDDASVTVNGIDKSWVQVVPPHVPVFAQGEASVRVIFQPPADPLHTLAGIYPLRDRRLIPGTGWRTGQHEGGSRNPIRRGLPD